MRVVAPCQLPPPPFGPLFKFVIVTKATYVIINNTSVYILRNMGEGREGRGGRWRGRVGRGGSQREKG